MKIKTILLSFMSIILIGATSADSYGRWYDGIPPEKYQTNDVVVPVLFVHPSKINDLCGVPVTILPEGSIVMACTRSVKTGEKVIVMPNPCLFSDIEYYARIQCHENAHYQGWGKFHEKN